MSLCKLRTERKGIALGQPDELRARGGSAAGECRPRRPVRAFVLGGYSSALQASPRSVSFCRRFPRNVYGWIATRGGPRVGRRGSIASGMCGGIRCAASEGLVPPRSAAGHHWSGFYKRRPTDCGGRGNAAVALSPARLLRIIQTFHPRSGVSTASSDTLDIADVASTSTTKWLGSSALPCETSLCVFQMKAAGTPSIQLC